MKTLQQPTYREFIEYKKSAEKKLMIMKFIMAILGIVILGLIIANIYYAVTSNVFTTPPAGSESQGQSPAEVPPSEDAPLLE